MLPEERDVSYLWDMAKAAEAILEYSKGMDLDRYLSDEMVQAAVERKVEIIGEAARRVSDGFKTAHPEVPWQKIISQRNVLSHEYGGIIQERMFNLIEVHIPALKNMLASLLPEH